MIVSAIVLGTIFSAWHIVTKQAAQYEQRSEYTRALSLGQSLLVHDKCEADSVHVTEEGELECFRKVHGQFEKVANYRIEHEQLIRSTISESDTFPLTGNSGFNNSVSPWLLALFLPRRSERYSRRFRRNVLHSLREILRALCGKTNYNPNEILSASISY
jgi:hypothetical protein